MFAPREKVASRPASTTADSWLGRLWRSMPEGYRNANWNTLPYYVASVVAGAYAAKYGAAVPLAWRPALAIVGPGAAWG